MIGVWIYFAGWALPLQWNIPLIGLALCSMFAVATSSRAYSSGWFPLTLAVMVFLAATAVSTWGSVDLSRSLRLSTPFLPAGLLFFVAASHWEGMRDIRRLYLVLSAVGLGLATTVLWGAWTAPYGLRLHALVPRLGVPMLVVPNDLTVLAVIAPLSWVLLCRTPLRLGSLVPALSLLLSAGAVGVYRSRTGILTMLVALLCATAVSQNVRRRWLWWVGGLVVLLLVLLTCLDVFHFSGPSLLTKFLERGLSGRNKYWTTAWAMFGDAPLVGQGPHTFGLFHKTPWAHNLYLEVLAEQGLLGLLALGGLLSCGLVGGWTLRRAPTEDGRLVGAGALAGLVGFCVAGVVEVSLLREWVVTVLFMLLGVISHLVSTQLHRGETHE
jgi:O-antigen ligase